MEGAGNIMEGTENTKEGAGTSRKEQGTPEKKQKTPEKDQSHQGEAGSTREGAESPRHALESPGDPRAEATQEGQHCGGAGAHCWGFLEIAFSGSLETWGSCWFVCLLCFAWSLGRFLGNLAKAPREHRGASPAPLPGDAPLRNHVRGPATGGCCPQSPPGAIWAEIPRVSPTAARRHACARPRTADMID